LLIAAIFPFIGIGPTRPAQLDEAWHFAELADFLASGDPPIVFTLGSDGLTLACNAIQLVLF
jgi:hypothetical protein